MEREYLLVFGITIASVLPLGKPTPPDLVSEERIFFAKHANFFIKYQNIKKKSQLSISKILLTKVKKIVKLFRLHLHKYLYCH